MAGDDFNDALACADVGIAMGTGTDVAMNSAQLKLVKGDLRGHATSTIFSVATVVNMKQNPAFAFVYNALAQSTSAREARLQACRHCPGTCRSVARRGSLSQAS